MLDVVCVCLICFIPTVLFGTGAGVLIAYSVHPTGYRETKMTSVEPVIVKNELCNYNFTWNDIRGTCVYPSYLALTPDGVSTVCNSPSRKVYAFFKAFETTPSKSAPIYCIESGANPNKTYEPRHIAALVFACILSIASTLCCIGCCRAASEF